LLTKAVAEGAGVLQMLRWLGRAPESFMSGLPSALAASSLPAADTREGLRFDTKKLYESLDFERRARALPWQDVAVQAGGPESHMRGLRKGGRTVFPGVMRLTQWLRQPASDFIRLSQH